MAISPLGPGPAATQGAGRGRHGGLPPDRDAGVSNVLGAILMFGLLVLTLVMVQVRFVPVWDEDREARHMDDVAGQLALLSADLLRLASNQTSTPSTAPLDLRSEAGFRFFRSGSSQATAAFEPGAADLALSTPQLRLVAQDGRTFYGLDEDWELIVSGDTLTDVTQVRHLRVRVDMTQAYDDGDSASLAITDANGAFAGRATVTFRDFPSEQALEVRIYNKDGVEVSSALEAFFQQTTLEYMYIDLMDSELLYGDLLAAATGPVDLSLTRTGLGAEYTMVYSQTGTGGTVVVGTSGLIVPNYALATPAGRLTVEARNQRFPAQEYVLEHGAVLLVQADGAVVREPPAFELTATPSQAQVAWTLPGLDGDPAELGSRHVAIVATPAATARTVEGFAARLAIVIPTAHPAAWSAWLDDQARLAGLSAANGQYAVATTAANVTFTLYGPTADPNSTLEDVYLLLRNAPVRIELRPSG